MLTQALQAYSQRHDQFFGQQFQPVSTSQRLAQAMQYSALNGGKRIRPFLVYASGELLGAQLNDLDPCAVAVECVHAYSLIHDDLPAMDNDALRRGKPTCHIAFDEATAILAGDALQTMAFELLSQHTFAQVPVERQLAMVRSLATASGLAGMCGGQALDIEATNRAISITELEQIHHHKTGALITAAVELGVLAAPQSTADDLRILRDWSHAIGLAFQVQDDILDETGDTQTLGKQQGSDAALAKATYPALLGLEQAIAKRDALHEKALHALSQLPYNTDIFVEFTHYIVTRDR